MKKMDDSEILKSFDECISTLQETKKSIEIIKNIVDDITNCFKDGHKVIIFGNGGSAADSQHFAAEFIGRFCAERKSLPAISLTTDSSNLTAIGNDYSFDDVFARQCESLVMEGDIIIGISTSGKSKNVIKALQISKSKGGKTIGILGNDGGEIKNIVNTAIVVSSKSTPRIQESHRLILHIICEMVEKQFINS